MKIKKIFFEKRLFVISLILGSILAILQVVGKCIDVYGSLQGNLINFVNIFSVLLYVAVFSVIIYFGYKFIDKIRGSTKKVINTKKYMFFIIWAVIFICFLPYLLNFSPAVITPDSTDQIYQAIGETNMNNHHPILHTLVIGMFLKVGSMFGNLNIGVMAFSIFQMLCLSATFAFIIYYMLKKEVNIYIIVISLIYFMFYPVHSVYSITIWKDIPFAIFMALFVIVINELIDGKKENIQSKKYWLIFVVVNLLVMLFRNNGVYVYALTMPILILAISKYRKKLLMVFGITLVSYFIIKTSLFAVFDVKKGNTKEALSIPLQQIARIYTYNRENISQEDIEKINKFFPVDNLDELYYPKISDNVKNVFSEDAFQKNKLEFITLWLKLCLENFRTAVDAFLNNCYGYWYPFASHWITMTGIDSGSYNINDIGIHNKQIIDSKIVNNLANIPNHKEYKIVSILFSIGLAVWLIMFVIGYLIYVKEYEKILIFIPIFVLWLTTIASPVFCEFRYVYSIFVCLPLLVGLSVCNNARRECL